MTRARSLLGASILLAGLSLVAVAQQPPAPPQLVAWAPKWKKGDWWVVKTYQRDLRERTRSAEPAEGAEPKVPDGVGTEPLPGLPPLKDGVPEGWKVANTFRFEVSRRELVRYPDDGPNDAPEPFIVVTMRTLDGDPRTAELWFTEADLTLAKVVREPGAKAKTHDVAGTAQLEPPETALVGFPLDWPDFVAAARPLADIKLEGRGTVEQRVRAQGQDVQVRLGLKQEGDEPSGRVLMTWRAGAPYWSRLVGPLYLAELTQQGNAANPPR